MPSTDFGFYPVRYDVKLPKFEIATLDDFDESVERVFCDPGVYRDWIYAPLGEVKSLGIPGTRTLPYVSRVFGLPKTHRLIHESDDPRRLTFLVWVFGFFVGMRMSDQEAGFLDAAALKPGASNDVIWCGQSLQAALSKADDFFGLHTEQREIELAIRAAIHSFMLSDLPTLLDFERFLHLYTATEAAAKVLELQSGNRTKTHTEKVERLCVELGLKTPWWADKSHNYIANHRNKAIHEGLFFGEPWGFMTFGGSDGAGTKHQIILLEMRKLLGRIIMALLGVRDETYLKSAVDDRQVHGIHLP